MSSTAGVRVQPPQRLAGGQAADLGGQVAAADPERVGDPDAGVVEQREHLLAAGARTRRRDRPGPGWTTLAKPEPEAADHRRAAVGAHHQQPLLGGVLA